MQPSICRHCAATIWPRGDHWFNSDQAGRDAQAFCAWSAARPDMPPHQPVFPSVRPEMIRHIERCQECQEAIIAKTSWPDEPTSEQRTSPSWLIPSDERALLRAKHRPGQNEAEHECQGCYDEDPCDASKLLVAYEALALRLEMLEALYEAHPTGRSS